MIPGGRRIGLAALAVTLLSTGCLVRGRARVVAEPVYVVSEAPPPPRPERVTVRAGHVWIRGHWENRGGDWLWRAGHWERDRAGHVWESGHWTRRGGAYHWVDGRWAVSGRVRVDRRGRREVDARPFEDRRPSTHPTMPPPAARAERVSPRRGYVWVPGYYRWRAGAYAWVAGHWEAERRGFAWEAGHWERRGDHYTWVAGRWLRR